jgi:integrase
LGLRQGEVLGLAWRDVDLDQRVLAVRQTLQYRPGEGFHLVPPKTTRSRRIVPLPDAVVEALKLRREQQETDRLAAGTEFWEDWGLVFTTRFGTPLSPRNDYRDFQGLIAAAGLRHVRLHDLRHTAASLMLAQGVSPRVVMEILGHSQISVTMNTYSHVTPASSREAVARVEGLLLERGHSELE